MSILLALNYFDLEQKKSYKVIDLKRMYKQRTMKIHPDRNSDLTILSKEEKEHLFKVLQTHYKVLLKYIEENKNEHGEIVFDLSKSQEASSLQNAFKNWHYPNVNAESFIHFYQFFNEERLEEFRNYQSFNAYFFEMVKRGRSGDFGVPYFSEIYFNWVKNHFNEITVNVSDVYKASLFREKQFDFLLQGGKYPLLEEKVSVGIVDILQENFFHVSYVVQEGMKQEGQINVQNLVKRELVYKLNPSKEKGGYLFYSAGSYSPDHYRLRGDVLIKHKIEDGWRIDFDKKIIEKVINVPFYKKLFNLIKGDQYVEGVDVHKKKFSVYFPFFKLTKVVQSKNKYHAPSGNYTQRIMFKTRFFSFKEK